MSRRASHELPLLLHEDFGLSTDLIPPTLFLYALVLLVSYMMYLISCFICTSPSAIGQGAHTDNPKFCVGLCKYSKPIFYAAKITKMTPLFMQCKAEYGNFLIKIDLRVGTITKLTPLFTKCNSPIW